MLISTASGSNVLEDDGVIGRCPSVADRDVNC
jgi:hypothetical protein